MNFGGDGGANRKRKVIYDEYTNGFYTESKMESLQRQCDFRSKMAGVLNRGEESKLTGKRKAVEAEKQIFELKNEKETTLHRENLRDYQAYREVLRNILKERENDKNWDDKYGMYGSGVSRLDLELEVQRQKTEMTPIIVRKRNAEKLLSQRKRVEVFDRKMNTTELLNKARKKRKQPDVESKSPEDSRRTPKLILPPITVTFRKEEDFESGAERRSTEVTNDFPSVFVTQQKHPV
ncbi:hypothetical protein FSP39_012978 [Pinctada imbricata]|uniref:Uncharacterized protein n=1 Tax=Pinctada imbricata TaxID=66713 RepID=A0AA89C1L9_PINIB|nr:hypothetical protein FSP39_012978 [Pinctada imbricata]